ncbi:MAG: hypothetical protein HY047_09355 [Acidobacteria bacterium]|nr:hypothetical protein [Acidobacteriota bacterium]
MKHRLFASLGALAVGAVFAAQTASVAGQSRTTPRTQKAMAKSSSMPARTPDGHPDLQGVYDLATLTTLERPAGVPLVMTDEQAAKLEKQVLDRIERASLPSKGDRDAPPVGGDGSVGAAGNVGGYNNFWIDSGTQYNLIDGQKRSSIVIDPPDGHVPQLTPEARQRAAARVVRATSDEQARENDPGLEAAPGAYDDPERRPLGERCLLGFGSTSGPPALPVLYNNLHQIVQTPDYIMILNEMDHDARIVRMNAEHLPPTIRKWMGDSVGRWEGDTLVVDTTNFTDKTRFRGSTQNLHVVERFTRKGANTLLYRFTVEDPSTWEKPWTGEFSWPATEERLYEYACHEGNYALGNILRGAREAEARKTGGRN